MLNTGSRKTRSILVLAAIFGLAAADFAEARAGRGGSFGSRGGATFRAPAPTQTAPRPATPIQRTTTPQPAPQSPAAVGAQRPGAATAAQARPQGRFGGGFLAGLLGAGLLGALFGAGFFGGLGSLAAIFGLLMQVALIVGVIWLVMRFFRSRQQQPAYAGAGHQRSAAPPSPRVYSGLGGSGLGGSSLGGSNLGSDAPAPATGDEPAIEPADFDVFERRLHQVQEAYADEDLAAMRAFATPEVVSYFAEEIADNARRGLVSRVSDVKLLQGDLSEAWSEHDADYATVAMRFSLVEAVVERDGGGVVEGSLDEPTEALEIWTFRRVPGGEWMLSAVQQG